MIAWQKSNYKEKFMSNKKVVLEEPNVDEWGSIAKTEKDFLRNLLETTLITLEHIGSTSIPNISAKPVIDFIGEVTSLEMIDSKKQLLEQNGYIWRGENGISERRYLKKPQNGRDEDLFHIHLFIVGHSQIARHILFRDYLLKYPDIATEYNELKKRLIKEFMGERAEYQEGKSGFIEKIISRAEKEFRK
jgi:GrpB-like predicted nucleotidyltransferase (UPF0157 family)